MKKVFALVLSLMMILCSVSALATEVTTEADTIVNANGGEFENNVDVRGSIRYHDGADNDISGQAATELWLQVEASGQIDVTVPLVLVFQTNIDGGAANSSDKYGIINHSSADLVVTKIEVQDVKVNEEPTMENVEWKTSPLKEDQYKAQLSVDAQMGEGYAEKHDFDLHTKKYIGERWQGGIFELKKAPKNADVNKGEGTKTAIQLSMETGKLSFVTSRVEEDPKDTKSQLNDKMDTAKGIQLMTITYTVAIDTSDAYGEEITTNANVADKDNLLDGGRPGDTASHGKLVANEKSGAKKDRK